MGLTDINPRDLVENLSVANRQILEIARAINEDPAILLLDEPTASLSEDQIAWLFQKVRALVEGGTTVIYVSHRLDEVVELCDRCAILRDGELVAILDKEDMDRDLIVYHMVGREVKDQRLVREGSRGGVMLECRGLTQPGTFTDISFTLSGEVLESRDCRFKAQRLLNAI